MNKKIKEFINQLRDALPEEYRSGIIEVVEVSNNMDDSDSSINPGYEYSGGIWEDMDEDTYDEVSEKLPDFLDYKKDLYRYLNVPRSFSEGHWSKLIVVDLDENEVKLIDNLD